LFVVWAGDEGEFPFDVFLYWGFLKNKCVGVWGDSDQRGLVVDTPRGRTVIEGSRTVKRYAELVVVGKLCRVVEEFDVLQ